MTRSALRSTPIKFVNAKAVMSVRPRLRAATLLCLAAVLLLPLFSFAGVETRAVARSPSQLGPRNKSGDWVRHDARGIPYEVALEWLMGKETGWGSKRVLFAHLEPEHFTKDKILIVLKDISSKIPQPTTLNVTVLNDRALVKKRVEGYIGLIVSEETSYTRLTGGYSETCCPTDFTGAQYDRYSTHTRFILCIGGQSQEINAEVDHPLSKRQKVRRVRSKP